MITRILVAAAAALLSVGVSHADPPPFPDLGFYLQDNPEDYRVDASSPGITATQIYFRTPDGVLCNFLGGQAQCMGALPGLPPPEPTTSGTPRVYWIGTRTGLQPMVPSAPEPDDVRTLPPFHRITVDDVTCGVDLFGITACRDTQRRGFVLSPTGSGWLPQV